MSETKSGPEYASFFAVMGASAAMVFSGERPAGGSRGTGGSGGAGSCLQLAGARPGCCLRDGQEWHGHRGHVCHAARADHEVHHPSGHGWHHSYLRPGGGGPHRQLPE
ncbi:hypothetical protein HPG69_000045 [Diceros bicornis minor]|uniref:Uncharacterized protein n=1 Tax=Diceros bicornis minor TaxID=77932 RepID=A0A7J7EP53_DICBM|nr:hypothetical protein HPG69_000045 [Diceros bicornis minor]